MPTLEYLYLLNATDRGPVRRMEYIEQNGRGELRIEFADHTPAVGTCTRDQYTELVRTRAKISYLRGLGIRRRRPRKGRK